MSIRSIRPTPHVLGCVALVLAPFATAQEPISEPADAAALETGARESDELGKALRRILHLRGGTTLRVVARQVEGTWEYKRNGAYRPLPPEAVTRAVLEKDVLRELRQREREVPDGDAHGRALLASWMLDQGLLEEGLGELEEILAGDPDQLSARVALQAHRQRFSVPAFPEPSSAGEDLGQRWDEVLRWAAQRGRVSRELLLLDLAQRESREGLNERLGQELFESSTERRTFAAHALRRLYPGEELRPLLVRSVLDSAPSVRREAALALREVRDESMAVPLVRALESPHGRVRTNAAEALGTLGYEAAIPPLMARLAALQGGGGSNSVPHSHIFVGRQFAFVQDFDVEVAQFQAIADPQINVLIEGQALDVGVRGVEHVLYAQESRAIRSSLQQITGADPGPRNQDWLHWWEENRSPAR